MFSKMISSSMRQLSRNTSITRKHYSKSGRWKSLDIIEGGSGGIERSLLRVRRARPGESTRVIEFLRSHAIHSWPKHVQPTPGARVVLDDYMMRKLTQGQSLIAVRALTSSGVRQLAGAALCARACPWDSRVLLEFARCVKCARVRALLQLAAHIEDLPRLHQLYNARSIFVVSQMAVKDGERSAAVALSARSLVTGRELGCELIRIDATEPEVINVLEQLKFRKELEFAYKDFTDPESNAVFSDVDQRVVVFTAPGVK